MLVFKPVLISLGYQRYSKPSQSIVPASFHYLDETPEETFFSIHEQYLSSTGWLETKRENASIINGKYVPWLTFPAIHFLEKLNLQKMKVLEFGAGSSTVWFAEHALSVTSYEFHTGYFEAIQVIKNIYKNVILKNAIDGTNLQPKERDDKSASEYQHLLSLDELVESGTDWLSLDSTLLYSSVKEDLIGSNVILIDGGPRNYLMNLVANELSHDAIVIVDNSDLQGLQDGQKALLRAGFVEIPFRGLGPLNPYESTTSFYVKNMNLL